jgi:hypothetical protein
MTMTVREILESAKVKVETQIPIMQLRDYIEVGIEGMNKLFVLKEELRNVSEETSIQLGTVRDGRIS